jgi:hypothetical protein
MFLAGSNLQTVLNSQPMGLPVNLQGQLTLQHIEKLPSRGMKVPRLPSPLRHPLLNDTQPIAANQMPAIANLTPDIVLSILDARNLVQFLISHL